MKSDINRLIEEFKNILSEEHGNYLYYVKDQEDSFIERIPKK